MSTRSARRSFSAGSVSISLWPTPAFLAPSLLGHTTDDGFVSTIDINLIANWRLIRTLHPLLKRSDAGRANSATSGASSGKYAIWGAYAASKAGLEALVKTWAAELVNTPVKANLINPGATRTHMRAKAFPGRRCGDPSAAGSPRSPLRQLASPACELNGETVNFREWREQQAGKEAAIRSASDA